MRTVILIIGVGFIFCLAVLILSSGKGIYTLPEYEHGVGFCGKEYGVVIFNKDQAHVLFDEDNNTYVINIGHKDDPEVEELMALTLESCGELVD